MLTLLVVLVLEGLILGALARLALPGPDPLTVGQTILVGIAGALLAGLIAYWLLDRQAPSFLLAFACTFGILYAIRRSRGGTLSRPAPRRDRRR